jgi:hypothetical protein
MTMLGTIVAEIMNSPDFAEIMFLVAFILFLVETLRLVFMRENTTWGFHWVLVVAGLACVALGLLALPTGGSA